MPYEDEISPYGQFIEPSKELDEMARAVIGAAIEVHRELGAGCPEDSYQRALEVELTLRGIPFERQKIVDIVYKGVVVGKGKLDLLVGGLLVVEIKSCESLVPIHRLQTLTYMRLIHQPLGLLINFNVVLLKQGIRRVIASRLDPRFAE